MRILLQRVKEATVETGGEILGRIGKGLLLFVGITHTDDHETVDQLAGKCAQLRIFEDEDQRQCSVLDLELEALVVSQFTLYGST